MPKNASTGRSTYCGRAVRCTVSSMKDTVPCCCLYLFPGIVVMIVIYVLYHRNFESERGFDSKTLCD
jgi:hypothetical protein